MSSEENKFKMMCAIDDILNIIEYIDITKDDSFLMFKDEMEEVVYINLDTDTFNKENYITVSHELEW